MTVVLSIAVAFVTAFVTAAGTFFVQERRLSRQFQLEDKAIGVAHKLLRNPRYKKRTFRMIQHHLGGFEENELRQILVRAGAIRFKSRSGRELWGLIERNQHHLNHWQIDDEPENYPDDESALYRGAEHGERMS